MALEKQIVEFPLSSGVEGKVDPKQATQGRLADLKNARFDRQGEIAKRFGYSKETLAISAIDSFTSIDSLFETERGLNVIADVSESSQPFRDGEFALFKNEGTSTLTMMDYNSKYSSIANEGVTQSSVGGVGATFAKVGDYVCWTYTYVDPAGSPGTIYATMKNIVTGKTLLQDYVLATYGAALNEWNPWAKVVSGSGQFLIVYGDGDVWGGHVGHIYVRRIAASELAIVSSATTVTTGEKRTWKATAIPYTYEASAGILIMYQDGHNAAGNMPWMWAFVNASGVMTWNTAVTPLAAPTVALGGTLYLGCQLINDLDTSRTNLGFLAQYSDTGTMQYCGGYYSGGVGAHPRFTFTAEGTFALNYTTDVRVVFATGCIDPRTGTYLTSWAHICMISYEHDTTGAVGDFEVNCTEAWYVDFMFPGGGGQTIGPIMYQPWTLVVSEATRIGDVPHVLVSRTYEGQGAVELCVMNRIDPSRVVLSITGYGYGLRALTSNYYMRTRNISTDDYTFLGKSPLIEFDTDEWHGAFDCNQIASAGENLAIGYPSEIILDVSNTFQSFRAVKGWTLSSGGIPNVATGAKYINMPFRFYPEVLYQTTTPGGGLAAGVYQFKFIYEYRDDLGNIWRSAPSLAYEVTLGAPVFAFNFDLKVLQGESVDVMSNARILMYRTVVDGTVFRFVGNWSVANMVTTGWTDFSVNITSYTSDLDVLQNEPLYTEGGSAEIFNPHNVKLLCASPNRVFAVTHDDQFALQYSDERVPGYGLSMSTLKQIRFDSDGEIQAIEYLFGNVYVFKKNSIFVMGVSGGPDSSGSNGSFETPRQVSHEEGCSHPKSLLVTNDGIYFKATKGLFKINPSGQSVYVGKEIDEYKYYDIDWTANMYSQHENRFHLEGTELMLVYNTLYGQWGVWDNKTMDSMISFNESQVYSNEDDLYTESESLYKDANGFFQMLAETNWINLKQIQGLVRIWRIFFLGEYKSSHQLNVRIYYNYDMTNYEDRIFFVGTGDDERKLEYSPVIWPGPSKGRCTAIKLKVYDSHQSGTGQSFNLSNIRLEVGVLPRKLQGPKLKV